MTQSRIQYEDYCMILCRYCSTPPPHGSPENNSLEVVRGRLEQAGAMEFGSLEIRGVVNSYDTPEMGCLWVDL